MKDDHRLAILNLISEDILLGVKIHMIRLHNVIDHLALFIFSKLLEAVICRESKFFYFLADEDAWDNYSS